MRNEVKSLFLIIVGTQKYQIQISFFLPVSQDQSCPEKYKATNNWKKEHTYLLPTVEYWGYERALVGCYMGFSD